MVPQSLCTIYYNSILSTAINSSDESFATFIFTTYNYSWTRVNIIKYHYLRKEYQTALKYNNYGSDDAEENSAFILCSWHIFQFSERQQGLDTLGASTTFNIIQQYSHRYFLKNMPNYNMEKEDCVILLFMLHLNHLLTCEDEKQFNAVYKNKLLYNKKGEFKPSKLSIADKKKYNSEVLHHISVHVLTQVQYEPIFNMALYYSQQNVIHLSMLMEQENTNLASLPLFRQFLRERLVELNNDKFKQHFLSKTQKVPKDIVIQFKC